MIDEHKKLLSNLRNTSYGKALITFLKEEKEKIGNITEAKSWEETQGRQYAIKLIEKLFTFLDKKQEEGYTKNQYE